MITNKRFKFLILSTLTFFSLSTFNLASAFEYGGFGLRPADIENGTVRKNDSGFSYEMALNATKKDGLMVVNNTKTKKKFLVYAADSVSSTDGGFACKQFAEEKKNVGAWVSLDKNEVELDPGTSEIIPFTIKIPSNIDAGEHDGCFLVQEKKETTANTDKKSGIQLSIRTGIKLSVIIPGDLSKKILIDKFAITKKSNGNFVFNAAIKNSGNVSVDTDVRIVVKNLFGIPHKTLGGEFIVLRGEKSVWNLELPKPFWGGIYKAKLVAQYNPEIKGGLDVKKDKLNKLESNNTISFFSFPTTKGLILEIIIVLFIMFNLYLLSIWKRRKDWIKTWRKYTVARSTNIKVLAEKYNVNWKLLANANKIRAPYMLNAKQEINVPDDLEEEYNKKRISFVDKVKILFSGSKKKKKTTKKRK